MRKGTLKKKRKQLEELLLDRHEALGELALGMHIRGNWDDDLLTRGAAEVREVERELRLLDNPEPDSREEPEPEPDLPITGEHTTEHVLRDPGEHTQEHLLPSHQQDRAAEPEPTPVPEPAPEPVAPSAPPAAEAEADPAPAPAGEESVPAETEPEPDRAEAAAGDDQAEAADSGPETVAAAPAADGDGETPEKNELTRLAERVAAGQADARTRLETARATLSTESRTEVAAISREVVEDGEKLTAALQSAAARITTAEERADAAEKKLELESAANREAAAEWVRGQAAEIEADAALAVEMGQKAAGDAPAPASDDPVTAARISALETELAAEKAAREEALVTAEARVREIEKAAEEAEQRVAAAEAAASGVPEDEIDRALAERAEAKGREAATDWLRGQIAALRREIGDEVRKEGQPPEAGRPAEGGE